ncbi:MAG: ATP-dependent sacrificial sulfur transferase LarE, partial [Melioribacteraceae bacterium]|nr:ATP-dependent sacrificial sulfur transferase LarE [Melioribacteraceae bacterium]
YQSIGKVIIALSGGVDSCLASYLARKYLGKEDAIAVISDSPSLKRKDFELAKNFCLDHDIKYEIVFTSELENDNYNSNPSNRCYFCKNELYSELQDLVKTKYFDYNIINGNNYSDLGDYRPGLKSAEENGILSPFVDCNIDKLKIREIAKYFNLAVWDKPSSPCLSSRFPYGESISAEKLKKVENAEEILNEFGFEDVRVRSLGDTAKIEVEKNNVEKLKQKISEIEPRLNQIGFSIIEVDEEGLISGKMNRVLNEF